MKVGHEIRCPYCGHLMYVALDGQCSNTMKCPQCEGNIFLSLRIEAKRLHKIQDYPYTRGWITDILNDRFPKLKAPRDLRKPGLNPLPQEKLAWMLEEMEGMLDELKLARWLGYVLRLAEDLELLTNEQSQDLVRQDLLGDKPRKKL